MSEVKKRSEMDPAYMWAMTDLYPDDEAWEKELGVLEGRIPEYRDYEGKLGESADSWIIAGILQCFAARTTGTDTKPPLENTTSGFIFFNRRID